ncbi:prolyl oligopeptidase family serine peptidase [Nonomuraea dietziae]
MWRGWTSGPAGSRRCGPPRGSRCGGTSHAPPRAGAGAWCAGSPTARAPTRCPRGGTRATGSWSTAGGPGARCRIVSELDRHGKECALLTFPGEQHGWRRQETIVAVLEAELAFYEKIFWG